MLEVGIQAGVQGQQTVLYQADHSYIQNLNSIRHHLHRVCREHVNQIVRVQTIDGQVVTGRIIGCDRGLFYLGVPNQHGAGRAFFGPSDEAILTLVLYELLVIVLLS